MTPEVTRRCASFLFLALALATGFGLLSMPAFDWLSPITRLSGALGWLPLVLHAGLTWLCTTLVMRQLALHVHPAWYTRHTRWLALAVVGAALAWWLQSAYRLGSADGRALLWLQTLVLWLWPAGLLSAPLVPSRSRRNGDANGVEQAQYRWHDTGSMKEVEVGSAGHMALRRPRQQRSVGRKDDVVSAAEDTEEALPA
jgi:hypothetical protein